MPILGGDKVARLWAAFGRRPEAAAVDLVPVDVNGQPGVAAVGPDGGLVTVITVDVADDRVQRVWAVLNPDKLAAAAAAVGAEPGGPAPGAG